MLIFWNKKFFFIFFNLQLINKKVKNFLSRFNYCWIDLNGLFPYFLFPVGLKFSTGLKTFNEQVNDSSIISIAAELSNSPQ